MEDADLIYEKYVSELTLQKLKFIIGKCGLHLRLPWLLLGRILVEHFKQIREIYTVYPFFDVHRWYLSYY